MRVLTHASVLFVIYRYLEPFLPQLYADWIKPEYKLVPNETHMVPKLVCANLTSKHHYPLGMQKL